MKTSRARELFELIKKDGQKAIDQFIDNRMAEELFLDFKRSSNNGTSNNLSEEDRNNYEKAISGYGNSEGGILIWGVDSKRMDRGESLEECKLPIQDPRRFVRNLNHLGSGRTIPPHSEIENLEVLMDNKTEGFVVSLIPKCNIAPIQTVSGDFLVRVGSNFQKASYSYLSSQFGKRPEPIMFIMYIEDAPHIRENGSVKAAFAINVFNGGTTHLKSAYINFGIYQALSDKGLMVSQIDQANWNNYSQLGRFITFVAKEDFRIAPMSTIVPVLLTFEITDPIEEGIKIELSYGCEGSCIYHAVIENSKESVQSIYDKKVSPIVNSFLSTGKYEEREKENLRAVIRELIPLPKEFNTMTSYEEVNKSRTESL